MMHILQNFFFVCVRGAERTEGILPVELGRGATVRKEKREGNRNMGDSSSPFPLSLKDDHQFYSDI